MINLSPFFAEEITRVPLIFSAEILTIRTLFNGFHSFLTDFFKTLLLLIMIVLFCKYTTQIYNTILFYKK